MKHLYINSHHGALYCLHTRHFTKVGSGSSSQTLCATSLITAVTTLSMGCQSASAMKSL